MTKKKEPVYHKCNVALEPFTMRLCRGYKELDGTCEYLVKDNICVSRKVGLMKKRWLEGRL